MGLFDKLRGGENISLSPRAGLLLSAITMVAIDGDVDDDEMAIIRRLDGSGRTDDWDAAVKAWKTHSAEECIPLAAGALDNAQRLVAMANLVDIAMADGVLAGVEQQLLEEYVTAFGVDTGQVKAIVDIIAIKNNKSIFSC